MFESSLCHQHLKFDVALSQRHLLITELPLRRAVPHRHGSHCEEEEEAVRWKDQKAFGDSRATNDPCRNLINSHYVSAGPVAQQHAGRQPNRKLPHDAGRRPKTSSLPDTKLIVLMLNVITM